MALDSALADLAFLVGRILFGSVLAFTGINHFAQADQMAGYARSKGVPAAGLLVPATGVLLVLGGLGIVVGAYPVLAAGALAAFFAITTPVMHDFWSVDDPEQRQQELTHFLKNTALLGGSLALLALGGRSWAYALDLGLF